MCDNPYSGDKSQNLISRRIDEQRWQIREQKRSVFQSALDNARAASEAKKSNMRYQSMNAIVGMTVMQAPASDDRERVMECLWHDKQAAWMTGAGDGMPEKVISLSASILSLINDVLDMSKVKAGNYPYGRTL